MTPSRYIALFNKWHPKRMFATSDLGTILSPSIISGVYQESTGVTAGAVGSAVGLMLDERYDHVRGAELAPALEAANWVVSGADGTHIVTFSGGTMRYQSDTTTPTLDVAKAGVLTVGKVYEATAVCSTYVSGSLKLTALGVGGNVVDVVIANAAGTRRTIFQANTTTLQMLRANANVDLTLSSLSIREIAGSHAAQGTSGSRPALAAGGKVDYDGVDDSLVITFPSDMGTNCTVARAVPNGEAIILTGQTIGTTYTDSTDHCGLVIINTLPTATDLNRLRRWLNRRAG